MVFKISIIIYPQLDKMGSKSAKNGCFLVHSGFLLDYSGNSVKLWTIFYLFQVSLFVSKKLGLQLMPGCEDI